ncbi:MAG: 3-methyl-2-oxobutanoate hydroxymethyltransferase [Aequorivita sp.]|nr:3-methyl-2-oxobutanoate hydroxymethyltransferase [Aequorivita sp.]|tara:strand:+ start:174 stop:632 length:459 start_codon:yes stop_codon:yes gene_type:complete
MKLLVIIFASTIFTSTFAQNQFSEADAHKVVNIFFEGFHKGDTLLMKSVMANAIIMQTAYTDKKGRPKLNSDDPNGFLSAIANRQADQKWDERLLDYKVEIDGNLAHVWTPYEFWFNENFSHCGANSFTLAKFDDGWKIIHLIDSRRKEGCK